MDIARTVTAEHERHGELTEDRGVAPSYIAPNSWLHARRRPNTA